MKKQITNYGRFYSAMNALRMPGDPEDNKRLLVSQFTNGRTDSLREMTVAEYNRCCDTLEERSGQKAELRKQRSRTLRLIQQLGIDTTDWAQIDDFCRTPRIIGKVFRAISAGEHTALQRKLRAIKAKRAEEPQRAPERPQAKPKERYYLIDLGKQDPRYN